MASQKVHGITIGLDLDASGVSKSFSEINKSIRGTQQELKSVDKLLKLNPDNVVLLTQKQGLLADAIDKTQDKLTQLAKAKALADKDPNIDKNTKQYRELEQDIIKTRNALDKFNEEAKENERALNGVYDSTKKAGEGALQFGDVLKANLTSEVIIGGVKALGTAIKNVATSLVDAIKESSAYADEVNTLSKNYNLSTKEIQQYMKASELIDVDINTIAKSMSKLTKNMTSTSTGVVDAFKKLNVETKNADGSLRDSNEVFNETINALGKIEDETLQDSLALEIFGKSSAELGSLINGGAEQLKEFNKYLEENHLILSQEELDSLNGVQDAFDTLKATTDGLKQSLVAELSPVIMPIIESITQFMLDHKEDLENLVIQLGEWINSEGTQAFFGQVSQLAEDVAGVLKDIIEAITKTDEEKGKVNLLKLAWDAVYEVVHGILEMAREIVQLLSGTYDPSVAINSDANPYRRMGYQQSGGYGDIANLGNMRSGGFTSNLTINIQNANDINEQVVRGWATIINEELGQMA